MKASPKILIAGGGHVGLSFALLLAHHGIASTLIEKNRYPTISPDDDTDRSQYLDSRNTALSRRTVQIYQQIGLWDELASHACRIDEVHISELGSFGNATLKKEEEGVESFGQVMENAWLGRKLLLAVQNSELVTLMDATEVTAVDQDNTSVTVHYQKTNSCDENSDSSDLNNDAHHDVDDKKLSADLLVACDGRDSVVRDLLGIGTSVYDYKQSGIVGVVTTDKPHNHIGIERFSPAGPLAVLPLADVNQTRFSSLQGEVRAGSIEAGTDIDTDVNADANKDNIQDNAKNNIQDNAKNNVQDNATQQGYRRSVVWICPKGDEKRYLEDDDYFLQTLQETFGEQAGRFLQAGRRGAYPLTKVLAERQVQGRCVIMGNSAHTLHPVAGQGFNLCMRDADTLAKMLAGLMKRAEATESESSVDFGNLQTLQAYQQARLKDQKRVIKFCDAVVHGFTHRSPTIKFFRNLGLLAFDKVPKIKPLVATYAMGLKS